MLTFFQEETGSTFLLLVPGKIIVTASDSRVWEAQMWCSLISESRSEKEIMFSSSVFFLEHLLILYYKPPEWIHIYFFYFWFLFQDISLSFNTPTEFIYSHFLLWNFIRIVLISWIQYKFSDSWELLFI